MVGLPERKGPFFQRLLRKKYSVVHLLQSAEIEVPACLLDSVLSADW